MEPDARMMMHARQSMQEAASKHLFDRNVSMIDFGYPEHHGRIARDEVAIRIHVHQKLFGPQLETALETGLTTEIPESIGEFKTDVLEGIYFPRYYRYYWWWSPPNPRAGRADPMRGGVSISNARHYTYATLGALVRDRNTGEDMILSNWHVLAGDWSARPGLDILQPGRMDSGTSLDSVATLTRDAMDDNLDAAVARLTGSRGLINDQVDLGPLTGVTAPRLGMRVKKSGRRTSVTYGSITAIEGVVRISYSRVERVIRNVVTVEPYTPREQTSQGGDSGSIWVNEDTREAVGLHFAGSDFPERALAIDMQTVLDALRVNLVTDVETLRVSSTLREREREPA